MLNMSNEENVKYSVIACVLENTEMYIYFIKI